MYIGIDLGGTNIAVGLVGDDGKLLKSVLHADAQRARLHRDSKRYGKTCQGNTQYNRDIP